MAFDCPTFPTEQGRCASPENDCLALDGTLAGITACSGGCYDAGHLGDGVCDAEFSSCWVFNGEAGDCVVAGEPCFLDGETYGRISCHGTCVAEEVFGWASSSCYFELDCPAFPDGELGCDIVQNDCFEFWDGAYSEWQVDCSQTCGAEPLWPCDGVCDLAALCPQHPGGDDCGDCDVPGVPCYDAQGDGPGILDCDGGCALDGTVVGDGVCDLNLSCGSVTAEQPDCYSGGPCRDGAFTGVLGCDSTCIVAPDGTDGLCDAAAFCAAFPEEVAECAAPGMECALAGGEDGMQDCSGICVATEADADGTCEPTLDCAAFPAEVTDCSTPGAGCAGPGDLRVDCQGTCRPGIVLGDGVCNLPFFCTAFEDDGELEDCSEAGIECLDAAGATLAVDCAVTSCVDPALEADGTCQPQLNCDAFADEALDCHH